MPRSKKTSEQMRAASRARILGAARELFAQRGYFKCRVSDIARKAGMSQGNVYWYFSSKEDILKTILAEGFEAVGAVLLEAQSYSGSGVEKLAYATEQYVALGQEVYDFFTVFLSILPHGGEAFLQELGFDTPQIGQSYHHNLSIILTQAQSEGSIANIDPQILSMLFFGLLNGLIITYGDLWPTLPPELIRDAVLRLVGSRAALTMKATNDDEEGLVR
jgi:AcrR family transcriptional regulator